MEWNGGIEIYCGMYTVAVYNLLTMSLGFLSTIQAVYQQVLPAYFLVWYHVMVRK